MIFVILGTQDKPFPRILQALERELKKGTITGKVIVQAGCTSFKSKNMEIYDYLDIKTFNQFIKKSDLIITHGGVGSILDSIKKKKKVLVVPRRKDYNEHENDHQQQITQKFTELGYILSTNNVRNLDKKIQELKTFEPRKYKSNNRQIIKKLEEYIDHI